MSAAPIPAPAPVGGDDRECDYCPDGHRAPTSRPWAVWVAHERDGDGQPTHLTVATTGGHHVAESDAEWLRELIRRSPAPQVDEDPWCREETCRYRHWSSGDMPTHQRGSNCPPAALRSPVGDKP